MTKSHASKAKARGTDRVRVKTFTEADIERIAKADGDNPASSAADWAEAFIGLPPLKVPVNAKFDVDVVDWFKARGRGYQTRMNAVLRRYMEAQRKAG